MHSLPYTNDLLSHYQSLCHLPGFSLLQSGDKGRGRYDIVTALPYDALTMYRESSSLDEAFAALQERCIFTPSASDVPFQGGGIGYISYDLGAKLSGVPMAPSHPANDGPLLDFKFYDWAIIADHLKKRVDLVAMHRQPETATILDDIQARWRHPAVADAFVIEQSFTPLISKEAYKEAFDAIHKDIAHGRAYQVNYTQPFIATYHGEPWAIYKRLSQYNPVPYAAFLRVTGGDILSFSPERFLSMHDGLAVTSPIKGTEKRSTDATMDEVLRLSLATSLKNRAENVMIVDLMRNDLGRLAEPGTVRVSSLCEVQSFNAVHHLVSHIEAQYAPTVSPLDVFSACFPGGSITGAPKREAMHIIREHEPWARGVYCGSIAYVSSHGRLDSNIAIRTIRAMDTSLYMSAGGGLVMDSHWNDEYHECLTKIEAIVNGLK